MVDGDDSSASKTTSSVVDTSKVGATAPYSLHASDNPGALITYVTFTGDNYNEWSTELVNAIKAKRKLGFIDGSIPKPSIDDPNFELWSSVNSMIVGWIRSSIEARVRSTVTFISDSHKLWENLKKRFSVGNKVRIHHLKEQLSSCKQDGQSVMEYYGRLTKMWEELDMYKPTPACSCSAAVEYEKEREEEKVHQFVMGLDEARFGVVCQGIIASDTLIDLGDAYAKIVREEQRLNSSKEKEAQHNAVGFSTKKEALDSTNTAQTRRTNQCAHCGRSGHEKSKCWQLVGSPDWWEERSANRGDNRASRGGRGRGGSGSDRSRNSGTRANSAQATTSNSSSFPVFTEEQVRALTQMISEKTKSSERLSGKNKYGDLILDTGASHHMTGVISLLENVKSIHLCPVGFADGNKTFATHIGVFPLSDKITLVNVLYVPNLNCSLISMSKLLHQTH